MIYPPYSCSFHATYFSSEFAIPILFYLHYPAYDCELRSAAPVILENEKPLVINKTRYLTKLHILVILDIFITAYF